MYKNEVKERREFSVKERKTTVTEAFESHVIEKLGWRSRLEVYVEFKTEKFLQRFLSLEIMWLKKRFREMNVSETFKLWTGINDGGSRWGKKVS